MKKPIIIVRGIKTGQLYQFVEGTTFRHIISGKQGELTEKQIQGTRLNVELTAMCNENPNILNLIKTLGLKMEGSASESDEIKRQSLLNRNT